MAALSQPWLVGAIVIVVAIGVLEAICRANLIPSYVVPRPTSVATIVAQNWHAELAALASTMAAIAVGVACILILGVILGYSLYRSDLLGRAFEPMLGALFGMPVTLLFPVALVIFGRNYVAILAIAVSHCVIPVMVYTMQGLRGVPEVLVSTGRSFGLEGWRLFRKVLLPHASQMVFLGCRLGTIYMLTYVIGIEFLISYGGLGELISSSYLRFEAEKTFGYITITVIISALIYAGLKVAERSVQRRG